MTPERPRAEDKSELQRRSGKGILPLCMQSTRRRPLGDDPSVSASDFPRPHLSRDQRRKGCLWVPRLQPAMDLRSIGTGVCERNFFASLRTNPNECRRGVGKKEITHHGVVPHHPPHEKLSRFLGNCPRNRRSRKLQECHRRNRRLSGAGQNPETIYDNHHIFLSAICIERFGAHRASAKSP